MAIALAWVNDYPFSLMFDMTGPGGYMQHYYLVPWTRFQPYIVGMILGFILHRMRDKKTVKMNSVLVTWIWVWMYFVGWFKCSISFYFQALAFAIGCLVIYGLGPEFQKLHDYQITGEYTPAPKSARAMYNGLHRLAWSAVLSWVIFACTKGLGGPINTFLSWRAWAPLARMSYCMYLVHIATITYFLSLPRFLESTLDRVLPLLFSATLWP